MKKILTSLLLLSSTSFGATVEKVSISRRMEETPLMKASLSGNLKQMKKEISSGANVNAIAFRDQPRGGSPVLRYAIDSGNPRAVKLLLSKGANPNEFTDHAPIHTRSNNVRNLSLLSYAIRTKAPLSIIKELVKYGANIDGAPKVYGDLSALMVAAIVGYTDAAEYLLERSADPFAIDKYTKKTALDYAKENKHEAIVKLLNR